MEDATKSRVFLHQDGYVEVIFRGIIKAEEIRILVDEAQTLLNTHGSMNVLIDGRFGRVDRDAASFSALMSMGRFPALKKLYILTTTDVDNPIAIHGPSVVTSVLTAALGFRPAYISDEALIREKAKNS